MKAARLKAYQKGHWAEFLCAAYYMCCGYRLLSKRYKSPYGEIDLIASRGKTVVFIEVKARANVAQALESVRKTGRGRIERAAMHYIAQNPGYNDFSMRFDVAALVLLWNLVPVRFVRVDNAWLLGA